MLDPVIRSPRLVLLVLAAASLLRPDLASAIARACGADAVANTASVLCAAPSGPCSATAVTMSANIEVTSANGCTFDLGGRSLRIEKTMQVAGTGLIWVRNGGAITITATGKLKARGDYQQPSGQIIDGGAISLESNAAISHGGLIDVGGDTGGFVALSAADDLVLERGSVIQGRGASSFLDAGGRYGDGGEVELVSIGGSIAVRGVIDVSAAARGLGGFVAVDGARDVTIEHAIDASGGEIDGGDLDVFAGRTLTVKADLMVDSRARGGFGGRMSLFAGLEEQAGGALTIDGAVLQLSGSSRDGFGGDGGTLEVGVYGPLRIQGAGAAIRANAGGQFDGSGGAIFLAAGNTAGERNGDITIDAPISSQSGGAGGIGGLVAIAGSDDVALTAPINAFGKSQGGEMYVEAGGDATLGAVVDLSGKSATASPGWLVARAGSERIGTLTVGADIRAQGGLAGAQSGAITLSSCALRVLPGARIDVSSGAPSTIVLRSRQAASLGATSRYLARPGGRIETIHPAGQDPIVGTGVIFDPSRIDTVVADGGYELCPAP